MDTLSISTQSCASIFDKFGIATNTLIGDTQTLTKAEIANIAATNGLDAAQQKELVTEIKQNAVRKQGISIINGRRLATIALNAAIGVAVGLIIKHVQKMNELREQAAQLAQEFSNQSKSLSEQIDKYKDLNTQLDKVGISEEEVASIKESMLSIQESLIDSYGNEANGIDLVNGKYEEQIAILQRLTKEQALEHMGSNQKEYEKASKALNKTDTYKLGSAFSYNNISGMSEDQQRLYDFLMSHEGINIDQKGTYAKYGGKDYTVYNANLQLDADVKDAEEKLQKLYNDVQQFGQDTGIDVGHITSKISGQIADLQGNDKLKQHKEIYEGYVQAAVIANDNLRPLYKEATDAVQAYNDALSSGEGIEEAQAKLNEVKASVSQFTSEVADSEDVFDKIYKGVNSAAEAMYRMDKAFTSDDSVKQYAEQLRGLHDYNLKAMNFADGLTDAEEPVKALLDLFGLEEDQIGLLINKLIEYGYVIGEITKQQDATFTDLFKTEDIESLSKSIDDIQNAYKTLDDAITEYNTSGSLSLDTLQSVVDLGDDWLDYLVDEEGALKLDKEALQDLTKSRLEDMRAQAISNIANNVSDIQDEEGAKKYLASTNYELANSYNELTKAQLNSALATLKDKLTPDQYAAVEQKALADIEKINKLFDKVTVDDLSMRGGSADDKSVFSDLLEKEATLLEKQLEASVITFKEYSDKRKALIEEFYKAGKISAEEYYSALEKMHDYDLSVYDKVIGAVTKKIDDQINTLEKEKETIEENHQTKIDAIQEEIDALTKANDAKQAQIELEKAQYEAEQARRNRVQKVYNGQEVIYQADMEKVRDTQEAVEDKEFDMHISELEDQIESLEEEMDKATKVIDDQIEKLEEYKDEWNSVADAYSDAQDELLAKQILGQDLEKMILDTRMAELTIFKNDYIAAQQAMATAAWQSANEQVKAAQEAAKGAGGNGNSKSGNVDGGSNKPAAKKPSSSSSHGKILNGLNKTHMVALYHDGLDKGYVGDSVSDDKRLQLLQTAASGQLRPDEVPAILKKKELVFTEEQQKNILSALLSPADYGNKIISSIGKSKLNAQSSHAQSVSFTVGDIYLEKVNDVDKLSQAIINQFPNKALQALYKTK